MLVNYSLHKIDLINKFFNECQFHYTSGKEIECFIRKISAVTVLLIVSLFLIQLLTNILLLFLLLLPSTKVSLVA